VEATLEQLDFGLWLVVEVIASKLEALQAPKPDAPKG
jgi:hypothetical protein